MCVLDTRLQIVRELGCVEVLFGVKVMSVTKIILADYKHSSSSILHVITMRYNVEMKTVIILYIHYIHVTKHCAHYV